MIDLRVVNVYDGRHLTVDDLISNDYHELELYTGSLHKNDAMCVNFTLGYFKRNDEGTSLSLNVQDAILLACIDEHVPTMEGVSDPLPKIPVLYVPEVSYTIHAKVLIY